MLVLSRKVNDRIVLPDLGISIEVREIRGKQIRLGIQAPDEVKILRGELESEPGERQPKRGSGLPIEYVASSLGSDMVTFTS